MHSPQTRSAALVLDASRDERLGEPSGLVRLATSATMALLLMSAIDRLLTKHPRLRIDIALRTDNTAVVLAMALAGLGIARINRAVAAPHRVAGRLLMLLDGVTPNPCNPIYAVMLPDRQRLPKVCAGVDHPAAWMSEMSAESASPGSAAPEAVA